jgi:GDP-L-fucose synthase
LYNVGTGTDVTIKTLAKIIQKIIGHKGNIIWDSSKPDGTPRKLMNVSKMLAIGWSYKTELEEGVKKTYNWFLNNSHNYKENKLN